MKQNNIKSLAQNDTDCWTAMNIAPVPVETITKILTFDTTSIPNVEIKRAAENESIILFT